MAIYNFFAIEFFVEVSFPQFIIYNIIWQPILLMFLVTCLALRETTYHYSDVLEVLVLICHPTWSVSENINKTMYESKRNIKEILFKYESTTSTANKR